MLNQARPAGRQDGAPEDSRLVIVVPLIMIHRHTARLIVYPSLTMPGPAGAERFQRRRYAPAIHMHICVHLFFLPGPAVSRLSFVIFPPSRVRLPSPSRLAAFSPVADSECGRL